jgi:Predicted membrane protein
MQSTIESGRVSPIRSSERYVILDILRGIALFGICLANFPEFSLYTFLNKDVVEAMPTAGIDRIVKYLQYIFIDGKFYSLFSLLFGIGFTIIMSNLLKKNSNGMFIFYRRMIILLLIGFLHLMFLWSGDILMLYALIGMVLPLFRNMSDKKLLTTSVILILLPIVIDTMRVVLDYNPSAPFIATAQSFQSKYGINDDNFAIWLRDGQTYSDVLKFTVQGAFIRCQEFIDGNRILKVLGLFLFGLYIGRNRLYADLENKVAFLKKVRLYGFLVGLPVSCFFAWSSMNNNPLGLTVRAIAYAFSVIPMCLAYISTICLWYVKNKELTVFRFIAAPGRMAMTNYIGQSGFGMIIYYGIGFGLGASMGLVHVELVATAVFIVQILCSYFWLKHFQFGPLEWVWRMLTYRKRIKLTEN